MKLKKFLYALMELVALTPAGLARFTSAPLPTGVILAQAHMR